MVSRAPMVSQVFGRLHGAISGAKSKHGHRQSVMPRAVERNSVEKALSKLNPTLEHRKANLRDPALALPTFNCLG
jgi:hypothetical protein